jgi:hypothetical protein
VDSGPAANSTRKILPIASQSVLRIRQRTRLEYQSRNSVSSGSGKDSLGTQRASHARADVALRASITGVGRGVIGSGHYRRDVHSASTTITGSWDLRHSFDAKCCAAANCHCDVRHGHSFRSNSRGEVLGAGALDRCPRSPALTCHSPATLGHGVRVGAPSMQRPRGDRALWNLKSYAP